MNYLIIGGAGFLGLHFSRFLINNPRNSITILDNFSRAKKDIEFKKIINNPNVIIKNIDFSKTIDLKKISNNYDYILQFAAIIGVDNVIKEPLKVLNTNFLIQQNSIKIAQKQKSLKKFLFTSTSEVYAHSLKSKIIKIPTPEKVDLMIPSHPIRRYSYFISKIYGELMLSYSEIPHVIVRPHNIYGPRMGFSHVIPELFIKSLKSKENQKIELSSSNHTRSFCFIDDAVIMIHKLLINVKIKSHTFNIGNPNEEIKISKLFKYINLITDKKNIKFVNINPKNNSPSRRCPDTKKYENIFGKHNYIGIEQGLKKYFEWYKKII